MSKDPRGDLRLLIATPLVVFMIANAFALWFIDLTSRQGEFASLLAAELVSLALVMYLERIPSYAHASIKWILAGCVFLVALLAIAII